MSFQRRIATLPWPVMVLVVVAAGLFGGAVARLVFLEPDSRLGPTGWVLIAAVSAVGGVAAALRQRRLRAQGRFEAVLTAGEAMQAGRLPADPAARAEVLRMIPTQRGLLPLFRWVGPIMFGLVAVVSAAAALDGRPREWIGAAIFAVVACAYPVYHRRLKTRLDAVEEQLRRGL